MRDGTYVVLWGAGAIVAVALTIVSGATCNQSHPRQAAAAPLEPVVSQKPPPEQRAAAPVPGEHEMHWETDMSRVDARSRDEAHAVVRELVNFCAKRDPHGDTWEALERVEITKDDVLNIGRVWTIGATFDESKHQEELQGNVLWYQVTLDRQHIYPMKRVSGELCDLEHDAWNPPLEKR